MRAFLTATLAALAVAPVASAQTRIAVGAGYDLDRDAAFVGAGARLPLASPIGTLSLAPHADLYFRDNRANVQLNADALYHAPGPAFDPYLGAGLALGYDKPDGADADLSVGINFLVGADFLQAQRFRPFVQARITAGTGGSVGLGGGVTF